MTFDPLRYSQSYIGATIASTKKRFFWEFEVDG
jgi:hypothetical protein